jgi:phospholipase C
VATNLNDIATIVVVIMENRSFDHMLGYLNLPGPDRIALDGVSADPAWIKRHVNSASGTDYFSHSFAITEFVDPPHERADIATQIGSAVSPGAIPPLNGFVQSYMSAQPRNPAAGPPFDPAYVMGYYDQQTVPTFDYLARNFTVCDRWFASLPASTQPNRIMAMAGESAIDGNVTGIKGLPTQDLVYDWLSAKGIDWCVYQSGQATYVPFFMLMAKWRAPILSSLALHPSTGPFRKLDAFDAAWKGADPLPKVIFIEPEYTDGPHAAANDDHPETSVAFGQIFIADIFNTLRSNPARWQRTVMLVTYDEHGGFFDHVPPLPITTTITTPGVSPFETTGLRVPGLVISPFVEPGSVYSGMLDHTAILQFIADCFAGGAPYSDAVTKRQTQFSRLSQVLTRSTPRAAPDPAPSPGDTARTATPSENLSSNAMAMHIAIAQTATDYPSLYAQAMT